MKILPAWFVKCGLRLLVIGCFLLLSPACSVTGDVGNRSSSSHQDSLSANTIPTAAATEGNNTQSDGEGTAPYEPSPVPDTNSNPAAAAADATSIEIDFVGDVMMDSFIGSYIRKFGVDYPWKDVSPILQKADLAAANLETSVSGRGSTKKPKGFGFRSAPYTLKGLQDSGIDFVTLANNHILDFGPKALSDTLDSLDSYSIRHAGAGRTIGEAEQPAIIEKQGLKIGFLSYSAIIPWPAWIAGNDSPGVAPMKPNDNARLFANIEKAKKKCDILIVMPHWGVQYADRPLKWQTELARKMIDHGADAIVGTHPHVLQGIEFYHRKPIIYSTGNFVFLKKDDNAGHTAIFKMKFNKEGFVEGSVQPVNIRYCKANLLHPGDALSQKIIHRLSKLSGEFGTVVDEEGKFWPPPG